MKKYKVYVIAILLISIFSSVIVSAAPATAKDFYDLGVKAWAGGKYDDAIKNFDSALKLDPKHVESYAFKSRCLNLLKRHDEALQCIEKAIALDSADVLNNVLKGEILNALGRFQEALEVLKKCTSEYKIGYDHLAFSYLKLNDTENCLKSLRTYVFGSSFMKEYLDPEFKEKLGENPTFIEIMNDCRDELEDEYENTDILNDGILSEAAFLDPAEKMTESEKQSVLSFNSRYKTNMVNGNIYNEATAQANGIYSKMPQKKEFISAGRFYKKLSLVGLKGTYESKDAKVLYVGKLNGVTKAAIVSERVEITIKALKYTTEAQEYYVYTCNNGIWEVYGELFAISEEDD